MFSRRARWDAPVNALTLARQQHAGPLLDLTVSNPTRAGIPYPHDALAAALSRGAHASYDPDPRGLTSAREALAEHLGCDADDLILTASTSEAYSYLFKLLTDPGDEVLTATPTYPLLEHLAAMELVTLRSFPLALHRRWEIDRDAVAAQAGERLRALVVVHPNNPTGSFVTDAEQGMLAGFGVPIISDEVFLDYAIDTRGATLVRDDVLTFTLGGLSKSAGLPHFKLGWIRVSGPGRRAAIEALELIADNFLSVATPVQVALPELLAIAPQIRNAIRERIKSNLTVLRSTIARTPSAAVLPVEGGWSAVIRVPRVIPDEDLALALLERGVVVQPGYFFDFAHDGFLVVSLLTESATFAEGVARITEILPR